MALVREQPLRRRLPRDQGHAALPQRLRARLQPLLREGLQPRAARRAGGVDDAQALHHRLGARQPHARAGSPGPPSASTTRTSPSSAPARPASRPRQDLVRLGYGVTVFEALPVAGRHDARGRARPTACRASWSSRRSTTSSPRASNCACNTKVEIVDELLAQGYQAVFLAIGSHGGRKLRIPGRRPAGRACLHRLPAPGGAGRAGRRWASTCSCSAAATWPSTPPRPPCAWAPRRSRWPAWRAAQTMPANTWEIEEAEAEGIEIHHRPHLPARGRGERPHRRRRVQERHLHEASSPTAA